MDNSSRVRYNEEGQRPTRDNGLTEGHASRTDSLYERSPVTWRRSKIGRPGKDDRAMVVNPRIKQHIRIFLVCTWRPRSRYANDT
ncbi:MULTISPECIES: hypothetical protein [unclassified Moorena]|uniref:hypothetical protein n=1 Tax=unclassified Moorena TaxID=2683338 RepID=UPI0014005C2A|nr:MULTISPECIES: hypothetical protein [unclassified Moorena]NEO11396.1 hypothetical protein [Moorena sp. SIO3E8]NEP99233.1 hypothetical protein [Moorena sp. SIO3F7]